MCGPIAGFAGESSTTDDSIRIGDRVAIFHGGARLNGQVVGNAEVIDGIFLDYRWLVRLDNRVVSDGVPIDLVGVQGRYLVRI